MELPKGAFKGLARVVAPLSFWMSAGWAAYPYMIEHITTSMNEAIDMGEIRLFSTIMVISCVAAGIALAAYGFTGKDCSDADLLALGTAESLCPYCGNKIESSENQCSSCGNKIPKFENV